MRKRWSIWFVVGVVAGTCLLCAVPKASRAQRAEAVPQLDLDRMRGSWYEIARYPNKAQKGCTGKTFELIAFGNAKNSLQLVDSCATKKDYIEPRTSMAKQEKGGAGKLKIRHWVIFSRKRWVLAIAPDNAWILMGSPNRKELWVYSKTPALQAQVLADVEAKAAAQGYPSGKLVMTPQDMQVTEAPRSGSRPDLYLGQS